VLSSQLNLLFGVGSCIIISHLSISLFDNQCVSLRNVLLSDTPAWPLMQSLWGEGFRYGKPPIEHTSHARTLTFMGEAESDFIARKPYLQCLLSFPSLRKKGLKKLNTVQNQAYYKCVLRSDAPSTVPLQAKDEEYKAILAESDSAPKDECKAFLDHGAAALTLGDGRRDDNASGSEDDVHVPLRRRQGHRLPGHRRTVVYDSCSDSEAEMSDDDAFDGSHDHIEDVDTVQTTFEVEGQRVYQETHLQPGQRGHYVRYKVRCPYHNRPRGKWCSRCRNIGPAQCALGKNAPIAYLGVWLKHHNEFESAAKHISDCKPSMQDVHAYMVQHQLN
jgi:hypothetical protein